MSKLNRRNVLKSGLGIGAGLLITNPLTGFSSAPTTRGKAVNTTYASLVKHGRPKGDNLMVWSIAKVAKQSTAIQEIKNLRTKHNYKTRIKYSSNDKFKIPICLDLITYVANSRDIELNIVAFEGYKEVTKGLAPKAFQQRMLNAHSKMSIEGIPDVDIKAEDNFGPSQEFKDNVEGLNGYKLNTTSSRNAELMQLNDLISGLFFATLNETPVKAATKKTLIDNFREQFGIESKPKSGNYKNISFSFGQL